MKKVIFVLALALVVGMAAGCSCDPCNQCNPCEPCVAAPVYTSPCCPTPTGAVDGPWGRAAPAPVASPCSPCGY